MAFSQLPPARPQWPIAIRSETIATEEPETIITVRNRPEPWHSLDYVVSHHTGEVLFTVHGHPWGLSQRRDFRDASGLPLFELKCRWYDSSVLEVTLPGATALSKPLLTAKCRVAVQAPRAVLRFCNASRPTDGRPERRHLKYSSSHTRTESSNVGAETTMEILALDVDNLTQVAVVEDQRVAFIDRIKDPGVLAQGQKPPFRFRPMWTVRVAKGVDLALIAVAVVIVGQQVAGSSL
ncbi:uncharacterized protein DSM5745_07098 [Aspergillus mulundensis]|uniref:Tubby C-terminal domain-containing protein n=1 Tax=Aspergillus mulundensis TaxID=1810919 RepID=A0A3D8RKG1_9EURO|nr:Uncharacterized protein DSM5745_07098 [Aspergillus mulundensis]RDW74436.1 Uncharacterized protein DSM5745_07098 [Aspergillus mulundensis]